MNISNPARKSLNSDFVGRQYAFDAIEKLWNIPSGTPRSMLFWGDWNVGKSEVLWNLDKRCQGIIKVAYANLQCLGCDRNVKYVWQALAFALDKIDAISVFVGDGAFLKDPYPAFAAYLKQALNRKYPNQKLLLAIDQYEVFLDIPDATKILRQIEELTLEHDRLAFLLCGSHRSDRVDIGFKPSRTFWMGGFVWEETVQFVNQQPYKFDLEAAARLHELTSGQPWLVRGLCFNIIYEFNEMLEKESCEYRVAVFDVDEIANSDRFYENYRPYFASLWDKQISCGATTLQQVLSVLADEPEGLTVGAIARRMGGRWYSDQIITVCEVAMERHPGSLIKRRYDSSGRTVYRLAIELFRCWIVRTQK